MSATGAFYMKREILKGKKYLGWHIENGWKTHTNAQKIKIEAENKKKRIPTILLGFLVKILYLFLYNTLKFVYISII